MYFHSAGWLKITQILFLLHWMSYSDSIFTPLASLDGLTLGTLLGARRTVDPISQPRILLWKQNLTSQNNRGSRGGDGYCSNSRWTRLLNENRESAERIRVFSENRRIQWSESKTVVKIEPPQHLGSTSAQSFGPKPFSSLTYRLITISGRVLRPEQSAPALPLSFASK
jgi:hypothetical protein